MVIELPKSSNARMGNAGSSRQNTHKHRIKHCPVDSMKMPMPEQNELEQRFTKVLVSCLFNLLNEMNDTSKCWNGCDLSLNRLCLKRRLVSQNLILAKGKKLFANLVFTFETI